MITPAITSFSGEFRFLSNFYPCRIVYEGLDYHSVEHAYQAAKTEKQFRLPIRAAATPGKAKAMGRRVKLRDGWDDVKEDIMGMLLVQKFENDPLRTKLIETYPTQLIEGNNWGDTYWGVCGRKGKNRLGVLLMRVREELR